MSRLSVQSVVNPLPRQGQWVNVGLDAEVCGFLFPPPRGGLDSVGFRRMIPVPRRRIAQGLMRPLAVVVREPARQSPLRRQPIRVPEQSLAV